MTAARRIRHYMVVRAGDTAARLDSGSTQTIKEAWQTHLTDHLRKLDLGELGSKITVRVVAPPSPRWKLLLAGEHSEPFRTDPTPAGELVCAVELHVPNDCELSHDKVNELRTKLVAAVPDCTHMGADIPIHGTTYWAPTNAVDWLFGDREQANRLIGTPHLRQQHDTTGKGVNVVVVDQGVDKDRIRNFGGGWQEQDGPVPGMTKGGHGAMLVRNILDLAPDATIFDLPLIVGTITNRRAFLSEAHSAYLQMLHDIKMLRQSERWQGPWIFLNAWAIYDRESEWPRGDHSNGSQHAFNLVIGETVRRGFDVVFCAGNCGQFCPMQLCGTHDRGPGNSILGANSHPRVLTVGAVRADGMWLGYSSQGPGQPDIGGHGERENALRKPDLCAPSQFGEVADANTGNTGTSAASAVAAGAVAALRSRWSNAFSPADLKDILIQSARQPAGRRWNGRLGHGILDVGAAYQEAARRAAT
jgi:subtilisin family serine protease